MTRRRFGPIFAVLAALSIAATIPGASWAQSSQPVQVPIGQTGRQIPQPKGGVATVVSVDQPENCLRIRSGPGSSYDVIGCANMGAQLSITGVWTSNDWAQLADNGWVYGPQIQTDLRPPRTAYSGSPSYVVTEELAPDYSDWAYLPDYGYDTYWYGALPIYVYNVAVWNRLHPWWWHRGHHAWWWKGGHHGKRAWNAAEFRNFVRSGARRSVVTNRASISSFNRARAQRSLTTNRSISPTNLNRFNTNRLRSTNVFRSPAFSTPNRLRAGSVNAFRSRTFSTPRVLRSGSFGGSQFRGIGRSGGFGGARIGGRGGVHFGGGHFGGRGHGGGGGGRRR